jgi:aminopeptidase S
VQKRADGDFTMSATGVTIPKGSTGTAYVMVTPGTGLADVVNVAVTGSIPGVTGSFFDPIVQEGTPKNTVLNLNVSGAATPGTYSLTVTGSNAAGIVHTVQVPVTITTPSSILANGGFETGGFSPWFATTTCAYTPISLTSTSGVEAQTGTYFALMLGTGAACTQTLSQVVAIPTGSAHATLGFWVWILTAQTGTTAVDTLTVNVVNTSGTATKLGSLSNLNAGGYWSYVSYDVTPYIGKTVSINFTAVQAGTTNTDILLDNISLVTM